MWTLKQRYRLAAEKKLLEKNFPDFKFFNPTSSTDCYIYGPITSSQNNEYYIKICIPDFPNRCPKAFLCSPKRISDFKGNPLVNSGVSHKMHTLSPSSDGLIQLCLYREERWTASCSLLKLLIKAGLWFEAYEAHLKTGKDIDDFVRTME